jgi:hypothetical protein
VGGAAADPPSFDAHGSVEQVYATGLPAGVQVSLLSGSNVVATKSANRLGGILFRDVSPGDYTVTSGGETSPTLTVTQDPIKAGTSAAPSNASSLYSQTVPQDGYGYMTMRDGIKLAYSVHPPSDVTSALGAVLPSVTVPGDPNPAPTLIEYSGYGYADPAGPQSGIEALANLMGFTVVDVNMRGTGCSGGAYDFFEPLQSLDGYDVIETVAHQPWVANGKVGMLGISYGGISQLFTAQTQPPDLEAVAPLSVLDQTQTTLYPGGVLNTGFAVNWAEERVHDAMPAGPDTGQPWAYQKIQDGDTVCQANQALHPEAVDLLGKIRANDHYVPEVADPLSPITFVNKINVPVFMACQWTDEQTGGHCPTLAEHMSGTTKKWFTFSNGVHTDSLDPETYNRLYDFLSLYVARQAPATNLFRPIVQASAPIAFQSAFGIGGMTLPPDPIQTDPTNVTYAGAKSSFEALPQIRVLFDNGAGNASHPGWPYPAFEQSFPSFPIPGTAARSWYFGGSGSLGDSPTGADGADQFTWNAAARPPTDFTGDTGSGSGGLWTATPSYQWTQDPPGSAAAYVTQPLSQNTTVVGAGAVHAWVRSSTPNVDLQATVSEVRPDGKETFVQNGWVRANERKLDDAKSTPLEPVLSLRESDVQPMPQDQFTEVTIPLYYEGHMYRAGSRIRVRISAPNGDQPIWAFAETDPPGQTKVEIGHGPGMPSRLVLPIVPGVSTSTGLPPCPGLRGEPCRDYVPYANTPAETSPGSSGDGSHGGAGGTGGANHKKCKKQKRSHHHAAAAKKRHCHKKHRR